MTKRAAAAVTFVVSASLAFVPAPAPSSPAQEQVIHLQASQFVFDPGDITVQFGQGVRLDLASQDVVHGIYIDGYELAFTIRCSVTCGPLHPFMIGKIRVLPDFKWIRLLAGSTLAVIAGVLWSQKLESQAHRSGN
jgi:heme/copper-type cytochrome/quinol oxidase subunit 2